ncbi:transposase [Algisphaera agarilytica]|uniref:Transposase IS200-like domain-containing protein n=1 Tax=Algisphaera agarilytica TaxID=1385975 RepID=A0A7X0H7M7_9BACT|nr:transposase [Algisphaera agarilytica]MBB6430552.1 hypothetical protein [Algisphaera agarilytica]
MPLPGKAWFHVTIGTYASWLPGDTRGFRTRHHRIHSSGDHRHPPPQEEHAGLRRRHADRQATVIPSHLRETVGRTFVDHLRRLNHRLLVISVSGMHAHLLVELPKAFGTADHEIGRCKQAVALRVRGQIDQKLWAKGCGVKPIRDAGHQRNTLAYIERHGHEGAWVWSFRGAVDQDGGGAAPELRTGGLSVGEGGA